MTADTLARLLEDHGSAVRTFIHDAAAVEPHRWSEPRAPGKWSPAQETKHLTLGYAAFVRDLRGESRMRLRGRWWQRRLWRWLILPRIFREDRITVSARAPREARPAEILEDRESLIDELGRQVSTFETTVVKTHATEPRRRVTHPYFNRLTLEELLRLCAIHTRHHARFLTGQSGS